MAAVTADAIIVESQEWGSMELANDVFGALGSYSIPVRRPLWEAASSGDIQQFGPAFTSEVEKYVKVVASESHSGALDVIALLLLAIGDVCGREALREVMAIMEQRKLAED